MVPGVGVELRPSIENA